MEIESKMVTPSADIEGGEKIAWSLELPVDTTASIGAAGSGDGSGATGDGLVRCFFSWIGWSSC